jgi:hypothetical protein
VDAGAYSGDQPSSRADERSVNFVRRKFANERREDLKFGEPRNQMRQRRGRMAKVLLKRNAAARKGVLRFGGGVLPS